MTSTSNERPRARRIRPDVDLPRTFTIRESSHRIHNPFTSDKLATLGQALNPPAGTRMLDLACGTGELLCTWARDSWDRYVAAQWLNIRRWLDRNPDDELAGQMRAELASAPARYVRYQREYLGWGVFALMNR